MVAVWFAEVMTSKTPPDKALLMDRHAYQISHLIASFTVPMMRKLYHQFDGDMVQMIILGEISLHNVSEFFRKGGQHVHEKLLDDMARRGHLMNSCNVFSISEATGIPRETVRRKVGQLLKKGLLYRDEHKRLMVRSGVSAGFAKRNAETTEEILALAAKLQSLLNTANSQDD
jgi:hypothetical protein